MCCKAVKPQPKSTSFKLTARKPFSCCEIVFKRTTLHIIRFPQLELILFSITFPESEWVTPQLPSICGGNRAWPTAHPCHCHSLDWVRQIHKDISECSHVPSRVSEAQPHQTRYRTPTVKMPIQRNDCCHQFCKQKAQLLETAGSIACASVISSALLWRCWSSVISQDHCLKSVFPTLQDPK